MAHISRLFFLIQLLLSTRICSANFPVYWNVPTETCRKHGVNFSSLSDYGLTQNPNDRFRGERITILYDPGWFPALLDSDRNGGVPQEGNLSHHLELFRKDLEAAVPDPNFSGVGVIDFERWRPIWRENWGTLDKYRQRSIKIVQKKHPTWSKSKVERTAEQNFEKAAYKFFESTLLLARKMRPGGVWGYYAYPYCFNFTPKNPGQACTSNVMKDNDRSYWMFETGTALYPSVYMREKELNPEKRMKMVSGRIEESKRIARKNKMRKIVVLPYLAVKYQDTFNFLSKTDMKNSVKVSQSLGSSGLILWGATKDTNTAKKCQLLLDYVVNVIKPILKNTRNKG